LNVPNAIIIWRFGGCCKQDLPMKLPLSFTGVPNVVIPGETIPKYDYANVGMLQLFCIIQTNNQNRSK
jgi:hypothetical protein